MEKYTVDLALLKFASKCPCGGDMNNFKCKACGRAVSCPICGKECDISSNVPKCPDHGVEGWER